MSKSEAQRLIPQREFNKFYNKQSIKFSEFYKNKDSRKDSEDPEHSDKINWVKEGYIANQAKLFIIRVLKEFLLIFLCDERPELLKSLYVFLDSNDLKNLAVEINKIKSQCMSSMATDNIITEVMSGINLLNLFSSPKSQDSSYESFQNGHYESNFSDKELISNKGKYGIVMKAKHNVDMCNYAIKIVPFRYKNPKTIKQITREVELHAKCCNNPNVVSYKNSWLEEGNKGTSGYICNSTGVSYGNTISEEDSTKSYTSIEAEMTNLNEPCADQTHSAELYIQMEYCGSTLEFYINKRNEDILNNRKIFDLEEQKRSLRIFSQILRGLKHIHSINTAENESIIHRDLKPHNILFDANEEKIKIGDFGFATLHNNTEDTHSAGKGTPRYIAPEQKDGYQYDCKVDMYSAGIILFELYCPANKEKIDRYIKKLRTQRKLPSSFVKEFEDINSYVLKLTENLPSERPTAHNMLNEFKSSLSKEELIEINNKLEKKLEEIKNKPYSEKDLNNSVIYFENTIQNNLVFSIQDCKHVSVYVINALNLTSSFSITNCGLLNIYFKNINDSTLAINNKKGGAANAFGIPR